MDSTYLYQNYNADEEPEWSSCHPAGFSSYGSFSPGMCPNGYTTGWTIVVSESKTGAKCCPRYVPA